MFQIRLLSSTRVHLLRRARIGDLIESHDVSAFRAPFGKAWHVLGSRQLQPMRIEVRGALEDADADIARQLADALLADLPLITHLLVNEHAIPVMGGGGEVVVTPTLRGYAVSVGLLAVATTFGSPPPALLGPWALQFDNPAGMTHAQVL